MSSPASPPDLLYRVDVADGPNLGCCSFWSPKRSLAELYGGSRTDLDALLQLFTVPGTIVNAAAVLDARANPVETLEGIVGGSVGTPKDHFAYAGVLLKCCEAIASANYEWVVFDPRWFNGMPSADDGSASEWFCTRDEPVPAKHVGKPWLPKWQIT